MDKLSVCAFCFNFWTAEIKKWEVPMAGFERDITEMKSAAAAGCHSCAIFCANTELLDSYRENTKLLPTDHSRVFLVFNELYLSLTGLLGSNIGNTPLQHVLQPTSALEAKLSDVHHEPYTGSTSSFAQAREWMKTCRETHPQCRSTPAYVPTRLLQIDKESQMLYLKFKEELHHDIEYATLSHCWGQVVPQCLKKHNISCFKQGVSITDLPRTFQEAVTVCEQLDLQFIWIDCFCIIQDSLTDWEAEAPQMRHVYGNTALNIAATDSRDCHGGLFRERNAHCLKPFKFALVDIYSGGDDDEEQRAREAEKIENDPEHPGANWYLTDIGLCWERFEQAPLNRRSWVLQERLLSPRVLHFDKDQLVWECDSLTACDRFPKLEGIAGLVPDKKRIRASWEKLQAMQFEEQPIGQDLHDIWKPIIKSYTSSGLTRPTDRLIALEGIAHHLSDVYNSPYAAGFFMKNLESQLAWRLKRTQAPRAPDVDVAPSWSWARFPEEVDMLPQWKSVDTDQATRRLRSEELSEIHLCQVTNKKALADRWSPFGGAEELSLHIRCFMAQVKLVDFADVKAWPKGEHKMRVWREKDGDGSGKRPFNSSEHLPFDEARPINDLWPLSRHVHGPDGSAFSLWEGQSGSGVTVHTLSENQEDALDVRVDYDIWTDYRKRRTLHLMPTYEVTEYSPDDIWEKHNVRVFHGLILERVDDTSNRFRRIGVFAVDWAERHHFWRAAINTDVPGLTKHMTPVEAWPDLECDVKSGHSFKYDVKDSAPQYQIVIV